MVTQFDLGDLRVDVVRKDIKNIHLGVYPPHGKVRIAAPAWMELDAIRLFAINKLVWIKRQQKKLSAQERETPREYLERESHYVWGQRYLLQVVQADARPAVRLAHKRLVLQVRPGADVKKREEVLAHWYRDNLKRALPALLDKWQPIIGVRAEHCYVQHMKTKWGSCNPVTGNIRLNTELAKKPLECLEYIVVHELLHLCEPTHNDRFLSLMTKWMPHWRHCREKLNRLPVRNEHWGY
ncbi:MAG: SprT family zinc-dependent metalloprotease [Rhodanobacter sp.]